MTTMTDHVTFIDPHTVVGEIITETVTETVTPTFAGNVDVEKTNLLLKFWQRMKQAAIDLFRVTGDAIKSGLDKLLGFIPAPVLVGGTAALAAIPTVYNRVIDGAFWVIRKIGGFLGKAALWMGTAAHKATLAIAKAIYPISNDASARLTNWANKASVNAVFGLMRVQKDAAGLTNRAQTAFKSRNVRIAFMIAASIVAVGAFLPFLAGWFPVLAGPIAAVTQFLTTTPVVSHLVGNLFFAGVASHAGSLVGLWLLGKFLLVAGGIEMLWSLTRKAVTSSTAPKMNATEQRKHQFVEESTGKTLTVDQVADQAQKHLDDEVAKAQEQLAQVGQTQQGKANPNSYRPKKNNFNR